MLTAVNDDLLRFGCGRSGRSRQPRVNPNRGDRLGKCRSRRPKNGSAWITERSRKRARTESTQPDRSPSDYGSSILTNCRDMLKTPSRATSAHEATRSDIKRHPWLVHGHEQGRLWPIDGLALRTYP